MPRPKKNGLEYFPLDVDFFNDIKVRRIKKDCGASSISVLLCLLCNIYRDDGYYIGWNEDVGFVIAETIGVTEGAVHEIIIKATNVGFFNKNLFVKYQILTSRGIQKRYENIVKILNRKQNNILSNYNLLINSEETGVNSEESTQSKEKKKKFIEDTNVSSSRDSKAAGKQKINYEHDSKYYQAAKWLSEQTVDKSSRTMRKPTEPNLQNWADIFRLMKERDKIPWGDIRETLSWAVKDSFWREQILSAGNFRKHYNQLVAKMQNQGGDIFDGYNNGNNSKGNTGGANTNIPENYEGKLGNYL